MKIHSSQFEKSAHPHHISSLLYKTSFVHSEKSLLISKKIFFHGLLSSILLQCCTVFWSLMRCFSHTWKKNFCLGYQSKDNKIRNFLFKTNWIFHKDNKILFCLQITIFFCWFLSALWIPFKTLWKSLLEKQNVLHILSLK